jgi:cytochrome c-type biogenesis protein CcmH
MAALVVHRAAQAARPRAAGEGGAGMDADPALAVYRRQLAEIDDLAERGLIPTQEQRSARAEAARRLLGAADRGGVPFSLRSGRGLVLAAAAAAPLAALLIYLGVGSPQAPDQPFAARAAAWRSADPNSLDPEEIVVVLKGVARRRPTDPDPLYYLARAQEALGDPFSAEHSLRHALDLAPKRADLWASLGEALAAQNDGTQGDGAQGDGAQGDGAQGDGTQKDGMLGDDARSAFVRAAGLDPAAPAPAYYLARDRIARGDAAGGLAAWRTLLARMAPQDPRRPGLADEIAAVEKTGALPAPDAPDAAGTAAPSPAAGQNAFIRAMVARLAARLEADPDDPAGWAWLIRSYQVLGDQPREAAALARAKALFKTRPEALRTVMAASDGAAPGSAP